jgi:predicted peroxiredoxin
MSRRAVVSITTGPDHPERLHVAFRVAVGAAEDGRPTLIFLTEEAVRFAVRGAASGVTFPGFPPLAELLDRYRTAGGTVLVCPVSFRAKALDEDQLIDGAEIGGVTPLWRWIGDDGAITFTY